MKNGVIYPLVDKAINTLQMLNLVELFKSIAVKLAGEKASIKTRTAYSRTAVDLFIFLKFSILAILLLTGWSSGWWTAVVWYLLATNLYTYFFYHLWATSVLKDRRFSIHRLKRRFMNLMFAILFSIIGFAYLYRNSYSPQYRWSNGGPNVADSLLFSIRNSLATDYEPVRITSTLGYAVASLQLLVMFVFLTVIISNSIPPINPGDKD